MCFGRACAPVLIPQTERCAPPRPSQLRCILFDLQIYIKSTKYLHMKSTELCLASSKILTPQPLSTQGVCTPRTKGGGLHTRREVREWGGQYFGRRQTLDWPLTVYSLCDTIYRTWDAHVKGFFLSIGPEAVKYEVPCPPLPPPPIAASQILPAIFWGQPVRPYALIFFSFFI